jgi:glycosyltransferase involved in cell wall biosynthesis
VLVTPQNRFGRQGAAYLATWLTDVGMTADGRRIDRVISFRFPAYAVRHPAHICWINHRMREYYDLWQPFVSGLGRRGRLKERVRRELFHSVDRWLLTRNVTRLLAQSRTIQERLARFGGISSDVLHPPAPERPYRCEGYGDYVFAVSRLDRLKRLGLLVEAAAHVPPGISFKIAGEGPEAGPLRERIRSLGLDRRVELLGRVSEDELLDHLARCRAVVFAPRDEDYGLVTLQAFRSGKAVITAQDSGGPTELVEDGANGYICAPEPQALAQRIGALAADGGLAERLGAAGRTIAEGHTWQRAVEALLA